jgi:hypothetical protein
MQHPLEFSGFAGLALHGQSIKQQAASRWLKPDLQNYGIKH